MGKLQVFNPLVQHGFVKPRCLHTDFQDFRWCFDGDGEDDGLSDADFEDYEGIGGPGSHAAAEASAAAAAGDAAAEAEAADRSADGISDYEDVEGTGFGGSIDSGLGYNDLVDMGYFDAKEQAMGASDRAQAADLTASLQDKGYDVTVSPDPEVGFSYQGPDAFSAAFDQIGTDVGRGVQAGIDMGLDLASATPMGMTIGALSDRTSPGYGIASQVIGEYEPAFQGLRDSITGLMSDAPQQTLSSVAPGGVDYSLSAFGDLEGPNVDLSTNPNFADTVAANTYDTSYNAPYTDTITMQDLDQAIRNDMQEAAATGMLGAGGEYSAMDYGTRGQAGYGNAAFDAGPGGSMHGVGSIGGPASEQAQYSNVDWSYMDSPDPFNNYADAVAEADAAMFGGGYGPPEESYPGESYEGDGKELIIVKNTTPAPDPDPDPVPPRPPYVPPVHTPVRFASMGLLAPTQIYGSPERQAMIRQYMADYPTLDRVFTRG